MWNRIQQSSVTEPRIQFSAEPKSALPLPPPKEVAPTVSSEKPIAVTTLADTIGAMTLIQNFAKSPSMPSTMPPMSTAPIIAP